MNLYILPFIACFGLSIPHSTRSFSFYSIVDYVSDLSCSYFECCNKKWTDEDFHALEKTLKLNVYGQNIMTEIVVSALRGHLRPNSPRSKALTLSFHGRPGVGKNYVATFIQNILFNKGYQSKHVHFFTGRIHFPVESEVGIYQSNLRKWISGNVTACEYSLFIFDEVDKMPHQVLDVLKPFIDYHERISGTDYRKSIFIFISNTGGELIAKEYLEYWKSGKKREDLRLRDFENLIRIGSFNEKGGFYKSETIESSLIDHYIPFLPLEEKHVVKCILDAFGKRNVSKPSPERVREIVQELTFGPEDNPIFSNGGCKRISPKVAAAVEQSYFHTEL